MDLMSFGRKFTVLKKVLVKLLRLFGAPIMIQRPENCSHLAPPVTPLANAIAAAQLCPPKNAHRSPPNSDL